MKAVKKKKRKNNLRNYLDHRVQIHKWLKRFREWREWKEYYEQEEESAKWQLRGEKNYYFEK